MGIVSGRRPGPGWHRASTLAAVLKDEPGSLRDLPDTPPRELERIIMRCLRKELLRRRHSMAEIKLALEELKEESDSGTLGAGEPARAFRQSRAVLGATALTTALVVGAGAWVLSRCGKQPDAPSYRVRQITRDEGISAFPALSHDGKLVAYS
jgi:eukaryotic-like serine/threonine-protein kinase